MSETKKYRLGNQPEEYELSEKYLGWIPKDLGSWKEFYRKHAARSFPEVVTLVSPNGEENVTFNLDHGISKDAFPLSFFGEARAAEWDNFLMVSEMGTPEAKFIIPMH